MTNLQGDVVSIVNVSGTKVVNYTYDAWGKVLTITGPLALSIGHLNPLRYRGYIYDPETKLYYLQSRYYDPEMGRFLNADVAVATGQGLLGNNMFAYCGNNPVNRTDPSGRLWAEIAAIVIGVVYYLVAYSGITDANYEHNSAVDNNPDTTTQNRILNDQNLATGQNFRYGDYPASHNACEAIAIHNAKVLLGMDSTLSDTIRDCQESGQMLLMGELGTNPWTVDLVLNRSGISSVKVSLDEMTTPGVYILSYWHSRGAHTVAIMFDGSVYTTYNLYGNGLEYYFHPSEYASNFISGYYLGS